MTQAKDNDAFPSFLPIIHEIEASLAEEYWPGAIQWADDTLDFAWSRAIHRFQQALSLALERKDYTLVRIEADHYRITILDLIEKYKAHKNMGQLDAFLGSIKK